MTVITETWLHSEIPDDNLVPPGYKIFRRDRPTRGGGVAVILKTSIKASLLAQSPDTESLCLRVSFGNKVIIVIAVYRPPDSGPDFLVNLRSHLASFSKNKLFILGDFNLPNFDWDRLKTRPDSCHSDDILDIMFSHNLVQIVQQPTRVCGNSSSLLDLVFLPRSFEKYHVSVEHGFSDHKIVFASISLHYKNAKSCPALKKVKDFAKANDTAITEYLENTWPNFNDHDVEVLWNKFKNMCLFCLRNFVPDKVKKTAKYTPWISRSIIHLKRKAKRLRKKRTAPQQLAEVRTTLYNAITRAKNFYFNTTLPNFLREEPHKFWNFIRQRNENITEISVDGSKLTNPRAIANHFNLFFHSVFSQSQLKQSNSIASYPDVNIVSHNGVLNMLLRLKNKSTPGPDCIPNAFLRRYAETLTKFLVLIFESSLRTATLPSDFKIARIVPIPKKGDPLLIPSYRPISMLSSACKLLEHVVSTFITQFLDTHQILSPFQHGFRKGFSTVTQLLTVVHHASSVLDKGGQVDLILLDFSKAFDRVSHDKLIDKLVQIGLPAFIVSWLTAYLSNRRQYVDINGSTSDALPVTSGVPQGSVLGPLLFLIFCNDIVNVINSPVQIRLFADDCILFNEINSIEDQLALNSALENVASWSKTTNMQLNHDKTVYLRMTRKKHPLEFSYCTCDQPLKQVDEHKYLGVTLTSTLSWNSHITNICAAAFRKLCLLRHKLKTAPSEVKYLAYTSIIRPKLEYACVIWDPHTKTNIECLERIQRRAVRFIYGMYGPTDSVSAQMERHGIPTLESRRKSFRLKLLYQLVNRKLLFDHSPYISRLETRRGRHSHSLALTPYFSKTNLFKFSFFPRTICEWNNLPFAALLSTDSIDAHVFLRM